MIGVSREFTAEEVKASAEEVVAAANDGRVAKMVVSLDGVDVADGFLTKVAAHLVGEGLPLDGLDVFVLLQYRKDGDETLAHPLGFVLGSFHRESDDEPDFTPIYQTYEALSSYAEGDSDECGHDGDDYEDQDEDGDYDDPPEVVVRVPLAFDLAASEDVSMAHIAGVARDWIADMLSVPVGAVALGQLTVVETKGQLGKVTVTAHAEVWSGDVTPSRIAALSGAVAELVERIVESKEQPDG